MEDINTLAKRYDLRVLEDAAQAHGAHYQHNRAGNLGDAAGWSFYPTKNLGAMGDAGAITTNNDDLANRLRAIRNYGSTKKNEIDYLGYNSRLDEIHAAILSAKLPFLDADNQRRRTLARRYLLEIKNPDVILPPADQIDQDAWHLFVIRHPRRSAFRQYLHERGIGTEVHYPTAPHKQRAYSAYTQASLPISEQLHQEVISLPLNPVLTDKEVSYIIDAINFFGG